MHKYKVGDMLLIIDHPAHTAESRYQVGAHCEVVELVDGEDPRLYNVGMSCSARFFGPVYGLSSQSILEGRTFAACEMILRKLPPPNDVLTDQQTEALWAELRWRPSLPIRIPHTLDEPMHTAGHPLRSLRRNLVPWLFGQTRWPLV